MNKRWLGLIGLVVLLAGCQPAEAPPPAVAEDTHAKMQAEMESGSPDLGNIVSVRLREQDKRVEVTSVLPAVISEATLSGQSAKTIFRVNDAGDGLILFSRDLLKGSSYRIEIQFAELESKKGFAFAIVQPDGSLQEQHFELEGIVHL